MNSIQRPRSVRRSAALASTVAVLALGLTACGSNDVEWDAEKIDEKLSAFVGEGADTETKSAEDMTEDESFSEQVKSMAGSDESKECTEVQEKMAEKADEGVKGIANSSGKSDEDSFMPGKSATLIVFEDEGAREDYSEASADYVEKCQGDTGDFEEAQTEIDGEDATLRQMEMPGFGDTEDSNFRMIELPSGNTLLQVSETVPTKDSGSLEEYGEEKKGEIEDLLKQLRD